jgi:hypothetical protein
VAHCSLSSSPRRQPDIIELIGVVVSDIADVLVWQVGVLVHFAVRHGLIATLGIHLSRSFHHVVSLLIDGLRLQGMVR